MAIKLTQHAADHTQAMLEQRGFGFGIGIRLATHQAGCSGLACIVEYLDAIAFVDKLFESHNPNVKNLCGCGESFNV